VTARLYSTGHLAPVPAVSLNPGDGSGGPFTTVSLNPQTYLTFETPDEAYALRDACQLAGDMLAGAEGATS
jgi:hypothetical protein